MYTSGCPKIQKRCCHSNGSAPSATEKNFALKLRWNVSNTNATVMTGMANTMRNWVTSVIQVSVGTRIMLMPLVRMLRMVTMRLMAPTSEAMPVIWRPSAQKSMPRPGEKVTSEFGAYMNQPPSAPPPKIHDRLTKMAPNRKVQKLKAFSRGKATSRAPICKGAK